MFRNALIIAGAWSLALGAQAQVLSLEGALRAGERQSPRLAAQRFALTAVEQQVGRAAELPDPRLRLGIENLPVTTADRYRYDRDFMTMRSIGLMQDFPRIERSVSSRSKTSLMLRGSRTMRFLISSLSRI